jgi:thiamine-phosphate pyrophosphorylase
MAFPLSPLYVIADDDAARASGWTLRDLVHAFLAGGARVVQVRAKSIASGALLDICDAVVAEAKVGGATAIINDRADLARMCGAAGVHLGQSDLPPAAVRAAFGQRLAIGFSTHSRAQVDAAIGQPIDYLAVGPVFGTTSKAGADPAVGLELVRYAASVACVPVVAIGGITLDRAAEVIEAGATSVALIADLLTGGDPERRVREYLDRLA